MPSGVDACEENRAAISGNIWLSDSGFPVLGSFAFSSRSAKLPGCGFTALMCASRFHTMVCMQLTAQLVGQLSSLTDLFSHWLPSLIISDVIGLSIFASSPHAINFERRWELA